MYYGTTSSSQLRDWHRSRKHEHYARHITKVSSNELAHALGVHDAWSQMLDEVLHGPTPDEDSLSSWANLWCSDRHSFSSQGDLPEHHCESVSMRPPPEPHSPSHRLQLAVLLESITQHYLLKLPPAHVPLSFFDYPASGTTVPDNISASPLPYSVLLPSSSGCCVNWHNIQALVESTTEVVTPSADTNIHPKILKLVTIMQKCLFAQPSRQYILGISMHRDGASGKCHHEVIALTRSQVLISPMSNTFSHAGISDLAAWLLFLRKASLRELGHLAFLGGPESNLFHYSLTTITLGETSYRVLSCIAPPRGSAFSKCTSAWRVQAVSPSSSASSGPVYVMKLLWALDSDFHGVIQGRGAQAKDLNEVKVLKHLKEQAAVDSDLAAVVPIYVASDLLGQAIDHNALRPRRLVAIVCEGEGQRVSVKVLPTLGDFFDFAISMWEGYYKVLKSGVAHKDISLNNILVRKDDQGKACAFLVDFGASALLKGFEPAEGWESRAHSVTMTVDCVCYAAYTAGRAKTYRFSVRQEVESLLNALCRVILYLSPAAKPKTQQSASFTSVTTPDPDSARETHSWNSSSESKQSPLQHPPHRSITVSTTPLDSTGIVPWKNYRLVLDAQDSIDKWFMTIDANESPLPVQLSEEGQAEVSIIEPLWSLLTELKILDTTHRIHPPDIERMAWIKATKGRSGISAEYLNPDQALKAMKEIPQAVMRVKSDCDPATLALKFPQCRR